MAKLTINFLNENGEVKPKDELLKEILWEVFGSESDPAKCEEIIRTAEAYRFFQMAVDMKKELEKEQPYKVLSLIESDIPILNRY